MTEKQKITHMRKHKDSTIDYVKTYDLGLTNSELKGVGGSEFNGTIMNITYQGV